MARTTCPVLICDFCQTALPSIPHQSAILNSPHFTTHIFDIHDPLRKKYKPPLTNSLIHKLSHHGEREGRNRRSVSFLTTSSLPIESYNHTHLTTHKVTHPKTAPQKTKTNIPPTHLATSPANAAQPTASSKPRTTPRCRSASARSTRTADTRARTRRMPFVDLCGRGLRETIV